MDMEALPLDVPVKQEVNMDGIAMPPPPVPMPSKLTNILKETFYDYPRKPNKFIANHTDINTTYCVYSNSYYSIWFWIFTDRKLFPECHRLSFWYAKIQWIILLISTESRKGIAKEKSEDSEEESGKKRPTRTKKQAEPMPPPPG